VILLGAALGYLGGLYYLSKVPKQYSATSTLCLQPPPAGSRASPRSATVESYHRNTVVERIRRFDLLEMVASRRDVRDLNGLVPQAPVWTPGWFDGRFREPADTQSPPPPPAVLADLISRWLTVSIRRGTSFIDISITHPVPEVAAVLANVVAREYPAGIHAERRKQLHERQSLLRLDELDPRTRTLKVQDRFDTKAAEMTGRPLQPRPDPAMPASAVAWKETLRTSALTEYRTIVNSPSERGLWEFLAQSLPDPPTHPGDRFRAAYPVTGGGGRMRERVQGEEVEQPAADMSSFARVPGPPSSPDRRQALTLGTLCGLLLALLLNGPRIE
jgi:uncharacterized protein involved in exopolysaccharide biosynthesis